MDCDLQIVLLEPEIPQNTGTIGRLCLGTKSKLHLVKPYGFTITDKALRRAGLDYWKHLDVTEHENIESFFQSRDRNRKMYLVETSSTQTIYNANFEKGSYLVFGKETTGIPLEVREKFQDQIYSIPIFDLRTRSYNLSNCVSICTFEAIRQIAFSHSQLEHR